MRRIRRVLAHAPSTATSASTSTQQRRVMHSSVTGAHRSRRSSRRRIGSDRSASFVCIGTQRMASFFFSSRRRHTRCSRDWSSDVCSSDLLEAVSEEVFERTPAALLELFVLLQQNEGLRGVRASTMRAVARNLWLIDEEFRQNPRHHRLFLEILRSPVGVTHELRRMDTYGVLGRYIPAFGRIVGRMQYDLFHAYTVDAHTLFEVINAFARKVGDETHLDYLYVLTCADVRATNPKLWNSWKASLFRDFYQRVKRALRRGLESPIDPEHLVRETQDAARRLLIERGVSEADIAGAWTRFSAGYFLQHSPEEIAWHARRLAERGAASDESLVALEPRSVRGTTAALIFTRPGRHGFARTTAALDQLGLNIVDARISPTGDGFSLDLYHLLEDDGAPITDNDRQVEIEQALWGSLRGAADAPFAVSRRAPRQARMFNTPTQIALSVDERNRRSVLELTAGDRPGLLCEVGKVLMAERVELHAAKIMTVGERAEDVFYLTDFDNRPLEPAAAKRLRERLVQALDERQAALREPAGGALRT